MERAFVSWSGGKDCCQACYRAVASGTQISYLLNMVTEDGMRSKSHGLAAKWIEMQAKALGIPLIQWPAANNDYEARFKEILSTLKRGGITTGVFGDIDFTPHREWIERVCSETGIVPVLPLWGEDQRKVMANFIGSGFKAVVVATRAELLGKEWLGRRIDPDFVTDLNKLGNISPCGEAGEYHTLVINGPLFQKMMEILGTNTILKEGHWFLDIVGCELKTKT